VSSFATSVVPGVVLEKHVRHLRFCLKRTWDTDVGHLFEVIGYHRDRRVSTLWSNCYSKLLVIKDEIQALETYDLSQ
jgi:hypothetical protein